MVKVYTPLHTGMVNEMPAWMFLRNNLANSDTYGLKEGTTSHSFKK